MLKKIFVFFLFIFVTEFIFSENNYSLNYSIGQNIIYTNNNTIKLPNQSIALSVKSSSFPNLYLSFGYNYIFEHKEENHFEENNFSRNFGIDTALGYDFTLFDENYFFSITPALSFNTARLFKNDYEHFESYQAGLKTILSLGIKINKHLGLTFSFIPQYNFFNKIYKSTKATQNIYTLDSESDTYKNEEIYVYDEKRDSYNKIKYYYPESESIFSPFGIQYAFSLGFNFTI